MKNKFSKSIDNPRKQSYISCTGLTTPIQQAGLFLTDFQQLKQRLQLIKTTGRNPSRTKRRTHQILTANPSVKIQSRLSIQELSQKPAKKQEKFLDTFKLGPGSYQVSNASTPAGRSFDITPRFPQDQLQSLKRRIKNRRRASYQDKILAKKIFSRNKKLEIHKPKNREAKIRINSFKKEILIDHHRETRQQIFQNRKISFKLKYDQKISRAEFRAKIKEISATAKTWSVFLCVLSASS